MMLEAVFPSGLLERVRGALPPGTPVYLVGGAVRDILMSRTAHDLDFVLPGNALETGQRVADALGAAFFPLDIERDTARVVLNQANGERLFIDFASLRAADLEGDLRDRDFTINAIAVSIHDPNQAIIDPLSGIRDLRSGVIRACSESAFLNDPLRILRAVRQAAAFGFQILPDTRQFMRQALPELERVSAERLRDELFKILDGPQPATALHALEILGVLPHLLPELTALKGVAQSPPHTLDVWAHTLGVLQKLDSILNALAPQHDPDANANWTMGLVSLRLGRYRQQLKDHFTTALNADRSLRALILLAALYHDAAKPQTRQVDAQQRIHFYEHEEVGAQMVSRRAQQLRLSNPEIERLVTIVRHHMRPILLAQAEGMPTRRAIYRFFRAAGPAGVDICLLTLADTLATYGATPPQDTWARQLDIVRILLGTWWENAEENISPPAVLNGNDLIQELHLSPGRTIGQLLENIREAQAVGEIHSREEALELARNWLAKHNEDENLLSQG